MFAIVLFVLFIAVIIFTLFGNTFVLILSLLARKLPSPVNCCYVSLAVADILVAAFAMTSKVVDFGLHFTTAFGEDHLNAEHKHADVAQWSSKNIICDVHHFLRIFACTASILHVCIVAIERCRSLDKPFGYMTHASYQATIIELIIVWTVSFLASALSAIWMYQVHEETAVIFASEEEDHAPKPSTILETIQFLPKPVNKTTEDHDDDDHDEDGKILFKDTVVEGDCVYPSSAIYLIGSSLISFYIPLSIMFTFYCKIYLLARHQLDSLKDAGEREGGRKTMPSKSPSGNWHYLSFRVHRGGVKAVTSSYNNNKNGTSTNSNKGAANNKHDSPVVNSNGVSNNNNSSPPPPPAPSASPLKIPHGSIVVMASNEVSATPDTVEQEVSAVEDEQEPPPKRRSRSRSSVLRCQAAQAGNRRVSIVPQAKKNRYPTIERLVTSFTPLGRGELFKKWQYYVNENKAVRTLGMLLGVFVSCWSPYFALNLVFAAVGRNNVPHDDILFDAFIWLGFLNSAFNPMLYALSAKEYKQGVSSLLRNFGLCRNPSSTSTASTLSTRLNPSRFDNNRSRDNASYIRRRREELARTIMALQDAEDGDINTVIGNLPPGELPYRLSITGCSLEPNFSPRRSSEISREHRQLLLELSGAYGRHLAAGSVTSDDYEALFDHVLEQVRARQIKEETGDNSKAKLPVSQSLQQIDLRQGNSRNSRWANFFHGRRLRSMPKMVLLCETTPTTAEAPSTINTANIPTEGDDGEGDDVVFESPKCKNYRKQARSSGDNSLDSGMSCPHPRSNPTSPTALITSFEDLCYKSQSRPPSRTIPSSDSGQLQKEAQKVVERLRVSNPGKMPSRRAASYYRQRKAPRGNRFVKNSRSNPRLGQLNGGLVVGSQDGTCNYSSASNICEETIKASPSTSSQMDTAPRLARMLIATAISSCLIQLEQQEKGPLQQEDKKQLQTDEDHQQANAGAGSNVGTSARDSNSKSASGRHQKLRFTKSLLPTTRRFLGQYNCLGLGFAGDNSPKEHYQSTIALSSDAERGHAPLSQSISSAAALCLQKGRGGVDFSKSPSTNLVASSRPPTPPPSASAIKFLASANEFFLLAPSAVNSGNGQQYPAISIADFTNPPHESISGKLSDPRRRSG